eukprot:364850-Chlamydomonas_euryale.AAC.2
MTALAAEMETEVTQRPVCRRSQWGACASVSCCALSGQEVRQKVRSTSTERLGWIGGIAKQTKLYLYACGTPADSWGKEDHWTQGHCKIRQGCSLTECHGFNMVHLRTALTAWLKQRPLDFLIFN